MWNVGKVWLRYFTRTPIRIKYQKQAAIDNIVNESVPVKKVNRLIKAMLTWNKKERMTFENFLSEDIFISEEEEEQISFYTSFLGHMKTMSHGPMN